jgi:hypothetical protein
LKVGFPKAVIHHWVDSTHPRSWSRAIDSRKPTDDQMLSCRLAGLQACRLAGLQAAKDGEGRGGTAEETNFTRMLLPFLI